MLFCSIFEDHGRFNRQCHNRMAVRKYHWDDKSRFLSVEEKEGEERLCPIVLQGTCLITGYLHFSRDIRKNVECSFILLADMTMIFFSK